MQKLFLTGGSGYVGRNLIRHFIAAGIPVIALVRGAKSAEIVAALGAVPVTVDITDASLADAMAGCQTLIHAAADTNHGRATCAAIAHQYRRHTQCLSSGPCSGSAHGGPYLDGIGAARR
ncbi:NAD(P)H-binding protein [Devosia sp. A8/3-2]|nr:NAD(P)H-binding protein [Devosia sp. A8/3-2]